MEFIPIRETIEENIAFVNHPDCQESIYMTVDYGKNITREKLFHQGT